MDLETLKIHLSYDQETGDFTRISAGKHHAWRIGMVTGAVDSDGYKVIKVSGRMYKAHRLAWLYMTGEFPEHQIDHVNRIRSDNRWENLRRATQGQNNQNRKIAKNNVSGKTGVYKQRNKWRAYIYNGRQNIHLGSFDSFEDAVKARSDAEREMFTHANSPPLSL